MKKITEIGGKNEFSDGSSVHLRQVLDHEVAGVDHAVYAVLKQKFFQKNWKKLKKKIEKNFFKNTESFFFLAIKLSGSGL